MRQEREKPALLISFGGEDPAGLTLPVLNQIMKRGEGLFSEIAVVRGAAAPQISLPEGVTLYESLPSLEPLWGKYDILITSFGLTPYEAERAGCGVVLVNPGSYHSRLARKGGFFSLGSGSKAVRLLGRRLKRIAAGEKKTLKPISSESVPDILKKFSTDSKAVCPLCGQEKNRAVVRFPDRTFYYCRSCRNYYLVNWRNEAEVYDREYFFSRYKAQYGKTYLEDFENIKQVSFDRLNHMEILLNENGGTPPKLVDLGCAFGPFLAAARDKGFDCRGVEINADGARWIEENLSIPVIRGSLEDKQVYDLIAREPVDGATLWYVIEHLSGQRELLTQLNLILKPGGMLAFGTPSGKGISARRNLRSFLENSPADHFVIYTPAGVRRILPRFGFSSVTVRSVGHHPERFAGWVGKKGSFTYNAMMAVSRLFSLGDSLEAYALKNVTKEPSE